LTFLRVVSILLTLVATDDNLNNRPSKAVQIQKLLLLRTPICPHNHFVIFKKF
jgi:hypothetical protein